MTSVCISSCVKDARVPVRPTYVNLYKWPESDADFVRSVSSRADRGPRPHPSVVDSISCRQMYLRSYTFSREEKKTWGKVRLKMPHRRRRKSNTESAGKKKKGGMFGKVRDESCAAVFSFFRRLLFRSAKVDVVVRGDG